MLLTKVKDLLPEIADKNKKGDTSNTCFAWQRFVAASVICLSLIRRKRNFYPKVGDIEALQGRSGSALKGDAGDIGWGHAALHTDGLIKRAIGPKKAAS